MTNQIRRLVDDEQVLVFVNDVEQSFHYWLQASCPRQAKSISSAVVKVKWNIWLPVLLMIVFAFTRWPGLHPPPNFSAFYALAFCAGVYFPRSLAWWLPLLTVVATDLVINLCYYHQPLASFQLVNYAVYALIIWLGTRFKPGASWFKLLSGGLLGAILFYLITNT